MFAQNVRKHWPLWPPLSILVLVIGSSQCVCLVASPTSFNHLCLEDNQTDPNIVNHRIDSDDNNNNFEDENFSHPHPNENFLLSESRNKVNFITGHSRLHPGPFGQKLGSLNKKVKEPHYPLRHYGEQQQNQRRKDGSMFIPVAAYSITKRKPKHKKQNQHQKMSASTISVRQKRPNVMYTVDNSADDGDDEPDEEEEENDDYEMRKESAVYGYIHKPEVIEFRGQYYYGQNEQDQAANNNYNNKQTMEFDSHESVSPMVTNERHRVSYIPLETYEEPSTTSILLEKLKKGMILFFQTLFILFIYLHLT